MRFKTLLSIVLLLLSSSAQANVLGSDIQNFNPTTNGLDFVTVESSETLDPGLINVGLFFNYAVNSLPNYEDKQTQERTNFDDTILGADFNLGYGIMHNWDIGINFPQVITESADDNNNVSAGRISQTGLADIRINTKYRLTGYRDGGFAIGAGANFNQITNNPFAGDGAGPTYNLQAIYDTTVERFNLGFNLGYRIREPGIQIEDSIEPFGNQWIASAAVSYLMASLDTKVIGEVYGSFPAEQVDRTTDRDVSSMELLVGLKTDVTRDIAVHYGGATEIYHGSSSPDWRLYAGLNWVIGPFWQDKPAFYRADKDIKEVDINEDPFAGRPSKTERFIARDILFDFNSANIRTEFVEILKRLVSYANRPPGFKRLYVEGHTDSVGSAKYNLDLSQLRADAVRNVLAKRLGLPNNKVVGIGYGESKPIADNGNFQGRAQNRRVEFRIER